MKYAFSKHIVRGITGSFSRFLSILAISALGVGFFSGLKITTPVMKKTADYYFDTQNLMDICILSTAGFNENDVNLVKQEPNIDEVYPAYSADVVIESSNGLKAARLHSMPVNALSDFMNRPVLVEGRMIEKSGECLVDKSYAESTKIHVGSTITISSENDGNTLQMLKNLKYTVTGIVESPSYITIDRGRTLIGNGDLSCFIYIPDIDFALSRFTELYIAVTGADELLCYSDDYNDLINKTTSDLEKFAEKREQAQYEEMLKEANEQLEILRSTLSAEQLKTAEEKVKNIEKPEWFVLGRDINPGYMDYKSDTDRVNALTRVFPIFFLLIASLVSLTTMTRMVEEERTQIGVFKALGYGKISIALRYIVYSGSASILGSIIGASLGYWIFPSSIYNAYRILYTLPDIVLSFEIKYALIASLSVIVCITMVALSACYHELASVPAQLMRPKSPRSGSRVILERIQIIWRRLNFTQKVTVRNLFRYKKKFFMTTIGIAGCTALLLTGFGLRDSIGGIVNKQFDKIHDYDIIINLNYYSNAAEINSLNRYLSDMPGYYMYIMHASVDVGSKAADKMPAYLIVPEHTEKFDRIIHLRHRIDRDNNRIPLHDGAIITEKLADKLKVNAGDKIRIKFGNNKEITATIDDICENYINNYIYMTSDYYTRISENDPSYNQILYKHSDSGISDKQEEDIIIDILANKNVSAVFSTSKIRNGFEDMINNLNAIVALIIICACLLAFIVLYNLTNINISERIREIATIKVLGFYDKEVSAYVYRENMILTFIGMIIGLFGGIFLHKHVVKTAEVDIVMFDRNIKTISYILSAVYTLAFSAIVNFVIHFKLKKIHIVESLKSVE